MLRHDEFDGMMAASPAAASPRGGGSSRRTDRRLPNGLAPTPPHGMESMMPWFSALLPLLLLAGTSEGAAASPGPGWVAEHRFDTVASDPVQHGERLSAVLGCVGCHTPELTGEDWSEPGLGVLWTANLTHSAADWSAEQLTTMITDGRRPDRALMDMPSYLFSHIHPQDVAALVAYLKSRPVVGDQHPAPTVGPQLERDIASGEFRDSAQRVAEMEARWPPDMGPEHAFARHVVRATCVECHGMDLRGSDEPLADAPSRPDLRMVRAYPEEAFSTFMKTGTALGNRELKLMSAVARWRYANFTEREVEAVYAYLTEVARRDP
jgi:mono/diheme cytochrome c family protein